MAPNKRPKSRMGIAGGVVEEGESLNEYDFFLSHTILWKQKTKPITLRFAASTDQSWFIIRRVLAGHPFM